MKRAIKIDSDWSKIGCCSIKMSEIGGKSLCAAIKFAPILFNIAPLKTRQMNRKNERLLILIAFAAVVKKHSMFTLLCNHQWMDD